MKKLFIFIFFLSILFPIYAQDSLSQQFALEKEINKLQSLRVQDSLRMESLHRALEELIQLQKNQFKTTENEIDSLRMISQLEEIKKIKSNTQGSPVLFENDTLFTIYATLGAYSNSERAKTAEQKIKKLYDDPFFKPDSLKFGESLDAKTLTYKSDVLLAVSEIDALWVGTSQDSLLNTYKQKIEDAVLAAKKRNSFKTFLIQIFELIVILIVVSSLFLLINKGFKKIKNKLINNKSIFPNGIYLKTYQIIPRRILNLFISRILVLFKYFIYFLVIISSLTIALKIFPSTEIWAIKAQNILTDPLRKLYQSIIDYIPDLITVIIVILIVNWLLSIIKYFAKEIENKNLTITNFYPEWAKPTYMLIRLLIIILSVIIIFPYLPGSGTTAFQGVSVFFGILISIGSSSAIANAVSGIVLTYMRPFKKNDWIKTGEIIGLVLEKNTLVTRLKTINNEDVSVPNSAILSGATTNFSSIGRTDGLVITTEVAIDLNLDTRTVEGLLLSAALKTPGITNRLAPYLFHKRINDSTATIEVNAITFEPQNMYFIKSDLIRNIQKEFVTNKIPLRSVSIIQIEPNKIAGN